MKITKKQLKQMILESMSSTPLDIVDGDTGEIYADWEKPEWNDEQFNGMEADFEIWLSRKKNKDFIRHPDSEELTREYGPGWYVRNKWQDLKADQRAADRKLVGKYNLPADGWGIPEGKMKITKRQLRRIIKEEKTKLLHETGHNLDHETKATMVMEAVQQNLNDPNFVNWLFEELGMGV